MSISYLQFDVLVHNELLEAQIQILFSHCTNQLVKNLFTRTLYNFSRSFALLEAVAMKNWLHFTLEHVKLRNVFTARDSMQLRQHCCSTAENLWWWPVQTTQHPPPAGIWGVASSALHNGPVLKIAWFMILKLNLQKKVLFLQTDFLPWELLLIKKLEFEKTKPI